MGCGGVGVCGGEVVEGEGWVSRASHRSLTGFLEVSRRFLTGFS